VIDRRSTSRALRAHRRARRVRHLEEEDLIDALYKAYLTVIGVGIAIFYLTPVLGEEGASADLVRRIVDDGPAVIGVVIALAAFLGLRSGSRGGPLALEHADVAHVLLAPVPRGTVLRGAARQQVRGVLYAAAVIGAVLGCLAGQRLPSEVWEWVLAAVGTCILVGLVAWGAALIGSGLRIGRHVATAVGGVLVLWAAADVALGTTVSPMSQVGRVAITPLHWSPLALVGIAIVLAIPAVGLVLIGGVSVEQAQRRAGLVGQLRFAATVQDVRTAMVLHRQLSQEQSRSRPWWRVRLSAPGRPCWYRDWQGIARWPGTRFVRAGVLGVVAGLALGAVWEGATALVLVAGVALFFVALDGAEGLGQETDHLDRPLGYPRPWGDLVLHHLVVPACWCALVMLSTVGTVFALTGSAEAAGVTAVVLIPAAIAAAVAAGAALALGVPAPELGLGFGGLNELGPLLLLLRQAFPPVIVIVALVPMAITPEHGESAISNAAGFLPFVVIAVGAVGFWLRSRKLAAG
jgi:hypothetical protein